MPKEGDRLFKNTGKKIIIMITVIVAIVMFLFSLIVIVSYDFAVYRTADDELSGRFRTASFCINRFYNDDGFTRYDELREGIFGGGGDAEDGEYLTFFLIEDELVKSTENDIFDEGEYPDVSHFRDGRITQFKLRSMTFHGVKASQGKITVLILANVTAEHRAFSKLSIAVAVAYVLVLAAVLLISKYYTRLIIKPIKRAYLKQVYFVQDSSHEMRTPLAVIRGKAEILAGYPNDTIEEHSREIGEIVSEIAAMEKMNKNLLLLSKEDVFSQPTLTEFGLYDMLYELSDGLFSMLAEMQEKEFSFSVEPRELVVRWDRERMKQAFTIILDNAFKYTVSGDRITVNARADNYRVTVDFYDSGTGIKSEELPRIFDRFYRTDGSRASGVSGSGIGLSMLRSFGNNLGFSIKVTSKYGEFTQFTVTAPINMK